jgi:phage tail protein X
MKALNCIEHVTQAGERWDSLAWRYYGSPMDYGRIIEANPALDISSALPSGTKVLIPVLPASAAAQALQAEELPPWKR